MGTNSRTSAAQVPQLSTVAAIAVLAALFVAAWGGLLLTWNGVYWDDWIYVSAAPGQVLRMTSELGLPWVGFLMEGLLAVGPKAYHVFSMLLFFSVGLSAFGILRRVPFVTPNERIFVSALVLVLPLMAARHTLIVQHYVVSYALFFLAWYLVVRSSPPRRSALWGAGFLFAVSFTTNSLLVFYVAPMAHLWYQAGHRARLPLRAFAWRYGPLLALPFVWYAVKRALFPPYGLYAGYNELIPELLVGGTVLLIASATPAAALFAGRRRLGPRLLRVLAPLATGLLLSALAVYPYLVVGKRFPFEGWETRNELLLPVGVAFLLLGVCRAIQLLLGLRAAQAAGAALIVGSVVTSVSICAAYSVDWQKQQMLIRLFRDSPAVRNASTVVFRDQARHLNIFGRGYRFYEWNGLMKRAFGDESRFGVNDVRRQVQRLLSGQLSSYAHYAARDYVPGTRVLLVTITAGPTREDIKIQTEQLTTRQALR